MYHHFPFWQVYRISSILSGNEPNCFYTKTRKENKNAEFSSVCFGLARAEAPLWTIVGIFTNPVTLSHTYSATLSLSKGALAL
jgi:hypothetical protein